MTMALGKLMTKERWGLQGFELGELECGIKDLGYHTDNGHPCPGLWWQWTLSPGPVLYLSQLWLGRLYRKIKKRGRIKLEHRVP